MDENPWRELNGMSYMALFEEHAAKYPEACKSPTDDDKKCPPQRLNKVYEHSPNWDSKGFLKRLVGKTILFIGDSMVRQLFTRSVCMNAEHIVYLNFNREKKDELHQVTFKVDGQEITFLNQWFRTAPDELSAIHKSADIAVLSIGAFLRNKIDLIKDVEQWHKLLAGQKLLYLEYPATHFPSPSGDYEDSIYYNPDKDHKHVATFIDFNNPDTEQDYYICQPMDSDVWKASEESFRVFTANEFFQNQSVPIIYDFYATVPVHEQHKGGVDCRHFCNPSPVLDMRINKLDEAIKALHKSV